MAGRFMAIQGREERRRGSALIMVMGVLVLLSIVGTAFVVFMRIETHATRNFNEDAEARMLALQALNYALAHPTWNPPTGSDVDNDNNGVKESAWFTYPLSDLASDVHARFAILKKTFTGRANINWNGFYNDYPLNDPVPFDNVHQAVNEGASTSEISLERIFESYIKAQIAAGAVGFAGADPNQAGSLARELALRICNYRYGLDIASMTTGTADHKLPGADGTDDTDFCDNFMYHDLGRIGAAPANRTFEDDAAWVYPNWRSDPARDWVNEKADGGFDITDASTPPNSLERIDKPQDFLQFPPDNMTLGGTWVVPARLNDDHPFGNSDLNSILTNAPSDLKRIVNDVFNNWAAANGVNGYEAARDYFGEYIRNILTTSNRDYIGKQTPINHLNILPPAAGDPDYDAHMLVVQADRSKFIAAMTETLTDGGMGRDAAINTSWQILANFIDYLDDDSIVTCLVKPEGWLDDVAHDLNSNHRIDAGEPGTRAFYGTERLPYINELWIYNRSSDKFDNDGNGTSDASVPPDAGEIDKNGYFIELYNHYDNKDHDPIVLYHDNPGGELVNWGIRITNSAGAQQGPIHYFWDAVTPAEIWSGGAWTPLAPGTDLVIPAGGYLVIENHDYKLENAQISALAAGSRLLPDPALGWPAPGALSPGGPGNPPQAVLVNLNLATTLKLWQPGDKVELVYKRDPRVAGEAAVEVVVDRQETPSDMSDVCAYVDVAGVAHAVGYPAAGPFRFWPSFEREDPRLARAITDNAQRLTPTWAFRNAAQGTGGGKIRSTVGRVNDNGDIAGDGSYLADTDVYDGNYRLGDDAWLNAEMLPTYVLPADTAKKFRFDDLVEIPNSPTYKFANVGALGNLLCVGPMPPSPTSFGWTSSDWLVVNSPYTSVLHDANAVYPANPLDCKKIDFTTMPDTADANPRGRFRAVFDKFTTFCPWKNGRDNNGNWVRATDDVNDALGDGTHIGDGGPSVGDQHVGDTGEAYVYGRIDINSVNDDDAGRAVLSGLPYVNALTTFLRDPGASIPDVTNVFLNPQKILDERPAGGYATRKDFLERVLIDTAGAGANGALDINSATYSPSTDVGAFGRDNEDNNIWQFGASMRRNARAYEWETLQRYPRTIWDNGLSNVEWQFDIEGINASTPQTGGDIADEKSEIDYTVGALMNAISLQSELPEGFTSSDLGPVTYFVTVDVTNGKDVDGLNFPGGSAAGTPQWTDPDVQVLAEKRIIALVDTRLPQTDPKRVTIFNWAVEGKSPAK